MRLKDADKLIEYCQSMIYDKWNHNTAPVSWANAYSDFIDDIDKMPTVDAIPVEQVARMFAKIALAPCGYRFDDDWCGEDCNNHKIKDCWLHALKEGWLDDCAR